MVAFFFLIKVPLCTRHFLGPEAFRGLSEGAVPRVLGGLRPKDKTRHRLIP